MTDLLRRAADRLHATHGTPSVPPVVALGLTDSELPILVWADGNAAEWHPGPREWKALPRADYRALFGPVWPDTAERPMGAQTFDGPEETQAEPDGPALGNVPTGAPCAD